MNPRMLLMLLLIVPVLAFAEAREIDDYQWEGVERVVAVGDIHGDYDNYMATLKLAGLVDKKGKWAAGRTHFVQLGDLPDRGPDTLRIIDHITQLAKQAKRKGGRVHSLIGNHEVMNVTGDLRYVHPGEYEAFVSRNSESLRDRYYQLYMERYEAADPEGFAQLPDDFRGQWEARHPLGWLEHRQAWDPKWNPDAEYARWVMDKKIAIRINDSLFLHGGIGPYYCGNSLQWMTEQAVERMSSFDPENAGLLTDPEGPLWYRGLAGQAPEEQSPPATVAQVDAILERHGARRIVVGHSPTSGIVWPRLDGRVVLADTGISAHYGGHVAYLEITGDGVFAGYPGGKLTLPASDAERADYATAVIALKPEDNQLPKRIELLRKADLSAPADAAGDGEEGVPVVPNCGTSQ